MAAHLTRRNTKYTTRRVQQIVKQAAVNASPHTFSIKLAWPMPSCN
jgi:hypothetical protein